MHNYTPIDPTEIINEVKASLEEEIIEVKKPEHQYTAYTPFLSFEEEDVNPLDSTHYLPMEISTDEDLNTCFKLCQEEIRKTKDDDKRSDLRNLVDAFINVSLNTHGSDYLTFFNKNVGNLVQYVIGDRNRKICINHPKISIPDDVDTLTGNMAVRFIGTIAKTGKPTHVPLFSSCFWVNITPFTELEMANLTMSLQQTNVNLGINTRGAGLTGEDIHIVGNIVEFILSHVEDCSIKGYERIDLRKIISANDIKVLMAAALSAIYPSGYPIWHVCTNVAKGLCSHNIMPQRKENGDYKPDSLLDFTKVVWTNREHLSTEQITLLDSPSRSVTYEDVVKAQKALQKRIISDKNKVKIIDFGDKSISIGFKVPSYAEYSMTSNNWVNSIKKMVEDAIMHDETVTAENREEKRSAFLNTSIAVSNLIKHLCWVEFIAITYSSGREITISDDKTIKAVLEDLIKANGFTPAFERAAQTFKEISLLSYTGVNNYVCPQCGGTQVHEHSPTPSLIPINVVSYFLSTMVWRGSTRQGME